MLSRRLLPPPGHDPRLAPLPCPVTPVLFSLSRHVYLPFSSADHRPPGSERERDQQASRRRREAAAEAPEFQQQQRFPLHLRVFEDGERLEEAPGAQVCLRPVAVGLQERGEPKLDCQLARLAQGAEVEEEELRRWRS